MGFMRAPAFRWLDAHGTPNDVRAEILHLPVIPFIVRSSTDPTDITVNVERLSEFLIRISVTSALTNSLT